MTRVPSDISDERMEDMRARDQADRLADALQRYGRCRHAANVAEGAFTASGEDVYARAARGHRADARAELHRWPALLAMVEPPEPEPVQAITSLVERIRPWTGTT